MSAPVFVRGISRSGGTLMVTILDAHPEVAMSYEIYEHLLAPADGEADPALRMLRELQSDLTADGQLKTFIGRAQRGGIERPQLAELLRRHVEAGKGLADKSSRLQFVERLGRAKAEQEGKSRWGCKVAGAYADLHAVFPDARYLFMQRDGRDIAASRKAVGNFNQTMEKVAIGWVNQVEKFQHFSTEQGCGYLVDYEKLTADPEPELRAIMAFLELEWHDQLLAFHQQDLSLYKNPTGHLSRDQVNRPINQSSVGRWKTELSAEEVAAFESVAGEKLRELGYPLS